MAALGSAGCPTRDKYDEPPAVRIVSPAVRTTYTNGTVRVSAAIDSIVPIVDLPIALLDNGIPLTTLVPPSYSWDWVTAAVPEGTHTIVAEVGFSSGPVRSAPVTVVVDRTPPAVVSRTPEPGARNVMLRAPIRVTFSEPVRLTQPAGATFSLSSGPGTSARAPIGIQAGLDAQGRTATLRIDDPAGFSLPAKLAGTIGATITDLAGNPLAVPSGDWWWDVPDAIKLPPTPLCPYLPALNKTLPLFAVGSDLKPVLASAAPVPLADGIHCQIQVSRYDGAAWMPLGVLSDNVDSAMRGAAMALTPDDQPIVAWRPNPLPDPGEIDVSLWTGTAWQPFPPIVPAAGVSFPIIYPVLRIGPDKHPVLLWGAGTAADRYFMARWSGSGWSDEFGTVPISNQQPFDGVHFDMILDDGGNPLVGWVNELTRGHVAIWDGRVWTSAPDVADMSEPFLALNSTRAPMIVSQGTGTFLVQHRASADIWQPHPTVNVPPQSRHPRLAAGPDGLPVVAWYDAQTKSIGMGRWLGQRWNTRATFFSPSNAVDEAPQLIVDRHGTAWAGWRDTDGQFNVWMLND